MTPATAPTAMIVATVVCAVACSVLVLAEFRRSRLTRRIAKIIASGAFIAVGVLSLAGCSALVPDWDTYRSIIVIGLVLGAVGDVALLGTSDRAFLVGLGAFLLGHIAYVVAIGTLVPPSEWLATAGMLAAAPAIVGGAALAYLWPRLGAMRLPVIAYVITIVAMVIGALAVLRVYAIPGSNRHLLALGAVLFFASDLAVARDKFVGASVTNRAWGLPCYYAGQLLIAWSLVPGVCA